MSKLAPFADRSAEPYTPRPVPKGPRVALIALSDVHLSARPPLARSEEPDWPVAMQRPLDEVKALQAEYECPVVIAGDVFDDGWRAHKIPPWLINFAITHLPRCYAVPGQHDWKKRLVDDQAQGYT